MISIRIIHNLPFIAGTITINEVDLFLPRLLLDPGSSYTVFQTDDLDKWNLYPEPGDKLIEVLGFGGRETVLEKQITQLKISEFSVSPFVIQYTALNQPIPMDGIVGLDFLYATGATIDFKNLELR